MSIRTGRGNGVLIRHVRQCVDGRKDFVCGASAAPRQRVGMKCDSCQLLRAVSMTDLYELFALLSIPVGVLLICRHLNLRGDRASLAAQSPVATEALQPTPAATQCGPLTRRAIARRWSVQHAD